MITVECPGCGKSVEIQVETSAVFLLGAVNLQVFLKPVVSDHRCGAGDIS